VRPTQQFTSESLRPCVPSPVGPSELLADLARAFGPLGIRWLVFGAQATLIWGRPRLTTDVDVTVDAGKLDTTALVTTLGDHHFVLQALATPEFVRNTRVLPLRHEPSGLALDLVLAGPGLEEEFLARSVVVDIGGTPVPVISPEDLIVTKLLAARAKDLEDVRGVLEERRALLDANRIRDVLSRLEAALGQSDLLPIFEREWARGL
jgi:hypothetical protein